MRTQDFTYELPEAAIAQAPVEPRDAARLLVATGLADHRFRELPALLDPGDLVVVNRTRVRAGRLRGRKPDTGGAVEVLLLDVDATGAWEALVRPARRLRAGAVVEFPGASATLEDDPDHGVTRLRFDLDPGALDDLLASAGEVPLPPYFHCALADPERYQTMFAKSLGSAAAPTAGLHFTPQVVAGLGERGVALTEVELRVGVDTFRPIASSTLDEHQMHSERYTVPAAAAEEIAAARRRGGRIVAVGTTVTRALEAAALPDGTVAARSGATDLFIRPGYRFRVVDRLVTNFHVPGSTLVVLVAAFMGPGWRRLYETALARRYRFLSFGDATLLDRAP